MNDTTTRTDADGRGQDLGTAGEHGMSEKDMLASMEAFEADDTPETERCRFCGCLVDTPCDEPPPDVCETAVARFYGWAAP